MASKANQPNREEMLQLAENAARSGQKEPARVMFRQVLNQDKRNERAMIGMARLARTKDERKKWLERVLLVNPDNDAARSALEKMAYSERAHQTRTLVIFGIIAAILLVVAIIVVIIISSA